MRRVGDTPLPDHELPSLASALESAISNGQVERVEALLKQGADILAIIPRSGLSTLMLADRCGAAASNKRDRSALARHGAKEHIKVALWCASIARLCRWSGSIFDAVLAKYISAIHHSIQRTPPQASNVDEYRRALAHAVHLDDAQIVTLLLSAGLSPNTTMPDRPPHESGISDLVPHLDQLAGAEFGRRYRRHRGDAGAADGRS
jgi:ankyrin repeat protein